MHERYYFSKSHDLDSQYKAEYWKSKGLIYAGVKLLFLPKAWVLLQTGRYDVLIFLAVDGAGGVDQTLQAGEPEAVVQAPQLEASQRGQSILFLLLVRGVVPEAHHTCTPDTDYRIDILVLIGLFICATVIWLLFMLSVFEEC